MDRDLILLLLVLLPAHLSKPASKLESLSARPEAGAYFAEAIAD